MMEDTPEDTYTSLSFNSYSSQSLAEIAGKAAGDDVPTSEDEFEFSLLPSEEFFFNGQVGSVFPVFCRDLLSSYDESAEVECIKVPLSKLLEETRRDEIERDPTSSSSSEADELESIPTGTDCVRRTKHPGPPAPPYPGRCRKSKSTGSASKRWKLPEFLRRSSSDGKDPLVIMTPKHRDDIKRDGTETWRKSTEKIAAAAGPHEALYIRNRAKKENDRRRSYLPYRPDLVGFFASANGLRRSSPHS